MTTMKDVARLAGVSAKTVSRVFNDEPFVVDATRERVQAAMRELNYVPNTLARSFRSGTDAVLAVAVPDLADPFFAAMIRSIEHAADAYGFAVMVTGLNRDITREQDSVEALLRRQVLGLIICPVSQDQSYLKPWQARTPIVFVDRRPSKLTADTIVEDNLGGARRATTHLIAHGHARIAFIGDSTELATTRLRLDGYHRAMHEAGLPVTPALVCLGATSSTAAGAAAAALASGADAPTAIFSANALGSMGIIAALQDLGRDDIGLVGFGDFPMSSVIRPALTVIDQHPDELGRLAVARLLLRRENPTKRLPQQVMLPVELVVRGSAETPPRPARRYIA